MAPRKPSRFSVAKNMTLSSSKITKNTQVTKRPPSNKKIQPTQNTQTKLTQSFKAIKKSVPTARNACNKSAPRESSVQPTTKSILAAHAKHLAQQSAELARSAKAAQRRREKLWTSGIPTKNGGRIYPVVRKPFTVKVEELGEKGTLSKNSACGGDAKTENDEEMSERDEGGAHRRGLGPNIGKTFDRAYPGVVEMVMNEILDEQDEAGSLCEFVESDGEYVTAEEEMKGGSMGVKE